MLRILEIIFVTGTLVVGLSRVWFSARWTKTRQPGDEVATPCGGSKTPMSPCGSSSR